MADGSRSFNFRAQQRPRPHQCEIFVDLFAHGGGASEGLKQAPGIDPALAAWSRIDRPEGAGDVVKLNLSLAEHSAEGRKAVGGAYGGR